MEPDEFRRRLLVASAAAANVVAALLRSLQPRPSTEDWRRFIRAAYPHVMTARRLSFEAAVEFYADMRPTQADAPPLEFVERRYPIERLERALEPVRLRLTGVDEVTAMIENEATAIVERHAMAAGRNGVEDAVKNDAEAIGWARVPSGAETCAFCTMLVSRGVRYKSRKAVDTAKGTTVLTAASGKTFITKTSTANGEPYHNRCDCVVVPVFDRNDWPGRDAYLDARAAWNAHPSLNRLRSHLTSSSDS